MSHKQQNANLILNNVQIEQKIRRIAYQIYENNVGEQQIILVGIAKNGYELAKRLEKVLLEISSLKIILGEVTVNKPKPLLPVKVSLKPELYANQSVILVDDVLNSGSTLIYGVKHFLEVPLKRFQTAVLVDRSHKKYPVKADFKGISLSTSINETVKVSFSSKQSKVELL